MKYRTLVLIAYNRVIEEHSTKRQQGNVGSLCTVPTSAVKFDQILPSFPFQFVTSKAVKKTRKTRKMLVEIVISD